MTTPAGVDVAVNGSEVQLSSKDKNDLKMAGTMRALINNMVKGVSEGYSNASSSWSASVTAPRCRARI